MPRPSPHAAPAPQMQDGALADRSTATPVPAPAPVTAPTTTRPRRATTTAAPVTQSEHDWVLSRVLRRWQPPIGLSAYDQASIHLRVRVLADGHFADIYDGRRRWDPAEVFDGYERLAPASVERRTIDALYRALRQAQPLDLPSALRSKAPFDLSLEFRARDVR